MQSHGKELYSVMVKLTVRFSASCQILYRPVLLFISLTVDFAYELIVWYIGIIKEQQSKRLNFIANYKRKSGAGWHMALLSKGFKPRKKTD